MQKTATKKHHVALRLVVDNTASGGFVRPPRRRVCLYLAQGKPGPLRNGTPAALKPRDRALRNTETTRKLRLTDAETGSEICDFISHTQIYAFCIGAVNAPCIGLRRKVHSMDAMQHERANRLKQARIDAEYESATNAAELHGWTVPTYLGHENGSRGFRYPTARKYARAFRVDADWLWSGEHSGLNAREREVIDGLRSLAPEQRQRVEDMILSLAPSEASGRERA